MESLINELQESIRILIKDLEKGTITTQQWKEAMRELLARYHTSSMMVGLGTDILPEMAGDIIEAGLQVQYDFLDEFYDDIIKADEPNFKRWQWRAELYVKSALIPYEEAKIYNDVGRFLPLPAMPKQGTNCGNNCGCKWRIVVISVENGDYDCYWERDKDDSCQICRVREEEWNPVYIRSNMLMPESYKP